MYQWASNQIMINSLAVVAAATATGNVDTLGADFVTIDVYTSTVAAASNRPAVLKISEADTTDVSNFSDITTCVGDGVGGFTVPAWFTTTATQQCFKFNIDCRHRKRYLKLTYNPRTTQDVVAIANLMRSEVSPITAAKANVLGLAVA